VREHRSDVCVREITSACVRDRKRLIVREKRGEIVCVEAKRDTVCVREGGWMRVRQEEGNSG